MRIEDWFDVNSEEHLRAWMHLSYTGAWPEGFIPPGTELRSGWHTLLAFKMADAWVNYRLQEDRLRAG